MLREKAERYLVTTSSYCVAGVALGDVALAWQACHLLTWQAWHIRHWAVSGGALGRVWRSGTLCGRRGT